MVEECLKDIKSQDYKKEIKYLELWTISKINQN